MVNAVYRLIFRGPKRYSYLLFNVEGQMQVINLVESNTFCDIPRVADFCLLQSVTLIFHLLFHKLSECYVFY